MGSRIFTYRYFIKLLLHFTFVFVFLLKLTAQEPERHNIFSYNVNEGLLQSTIGDLAIDKNNYCWISFPNGIQKFDGKTFTTIPPQSGLPDTRSPDFLQCSDGSLLISHRFGISIYDINRDAFRLVYKYKKEKKYPAHFIGEDDNRIYVFTEEATIICISYPECKVLSETATGLPDFREIAAKRTVAVNRIVQHRAVFSADKRLYLWDLNLGKMVASSDTISQLSVFTLHMLSDDQVVFFEHSNPSLLKRYNFSDKSTTSLQFKGKDDSRISRFHIFKWKGKQMISFANRLFETNDSLTVLHKEVVDFQNKSASKQSPVSRIVEDQYGNLYLSTVTSGIRKVLGHNFPIRYFGTDNTDQNFSLAVFADKKNNRILTGTISNGIYIFDTLQRLIKQIPFLSGDEKKFAVNAILQDKKGRYWISATGEKAFYRLSADLNKMERISFTQSKARHRHGIDYFANLLYQDERIALLQTQGLIYKIDFNTDNIYEFEFTSEYTHSGLFYQDQILSHADDELLFIDTSNFNIVKRIPFPNTAGVRCFAKDEDGNIFAGSNNGIYKISKEGKLIRHYNKENGLPDNCIYAIACLPGNILWCSSNKGIFKWQHERLQLQLKKEDGIQENEFNTNGIFLAPDNELFFTGVNGVSSFYPEKMTDYREKMSLLLTGLRINNETVSADTAVWNISKLELPYFKNSLSFDFLVMSDNNPDQYVYQYKMEGVDKTWMKRDDLQTIRYHLQPGKYVFKMYASRTFDPNAKPLKEIIIHIHPPFWKTWWFISLLAVLLILVLVFLINTVNRRKFEKKLSILEAEQKVKLERERISRDLHDSLGAYANAVLYNTELLQKENGTNERETLIKELRFASKDIITSLRETIWALKKDNFMAEDCLLRIRNFLQPFNRYFPHLIFRTEGEAPKNLLLHYTRALHLVRIVQEAVSNSIKHAEATNIVVLSEVVNNKWKITVSDDGKGFDYTLAAEQEEGNGLGNILQRAVEAGFEANISSEAGKGTIVTIII